MSAEIRGLAMDKKSRDELIVKYCPFVKNIVLRMAAKFPIDRADIDDLVNVGIIGLMGAVEKYDAKRNVQFETFAYLRIKGAVLDELRQRDWAPRSARSKDSHIEKALSELQKELGRQPEEEEIAGYMGVSIEEYHELLGDARGVSLLSAEDLPPDYLEKHSSAEALESLQNDNPLRNLLGGELMAGLKKSIDALPEKERLVLSLYYYEELTMKEVGRVMELTESRVCQLHAQAVLRLRSLVKDYR
jgi:RNA polymerase sigma factor for flagellar operon FliA